MIIKVDKVPVDLKLRQGPQTWKCATASEKEEERRKQRGSGLMGRCVLWGWGIRSRRRSLERRACGPRLLSV